MARREALFHLAIVTVLGSGILGAQACGLDEGGLPGSDDGGPLPDRFDGLDAGFDASVIDADSGIDSSVVDAADAAPPTGVPGTLSNLELWLTTTSGLFTNGGNVTQWVDQSGKNDPGRNAAPTGTPKLGDAGFGSAVFFGLSDGLRTGTWSQPLNDPSTVFVIAGKAPSGAINTYLFDSLDNSKRHAVLMRVDYQFWEYAGGFGSNVVGLVTDPMSIVAVFNGANSFLLQNTSNTDAGRNSPGAVSSITGFTVGNYPGGDLGLNGYIAEVAVYSRVLTDQEIATLNAYASTKYGVVIK
jgi:hypothetical protein